MGVAALRAAREGAALVHHLSYASLGARREQRRAA